MEGDDGLLYETCAICGTTDELVEVINSSEIIKVCPDCARKEGYPRIVKPTEEQLRKANRFYGVRERLAMAPGFRNDGFYYNKTSSERVLSDALKKVGLSTSKKSDEDKELEKIIIRNFKKVQREDLIDNFHWHILNARRARKMSQKQLANAIAEPEIVVELAEQGKLPDDYE
ncbi:MAG: hypothetical protein QXJ28_02810, partial [Candidatus Pacearchaeota archaeon]